MVPQPDYTNGEQPARQYQQTFCSSDAALYIGMSESWLRQSRMSGRLHGPPFLRLGSRAVRYLRTDLDRWLQERRDPRSALTDERDHAAATSIRRTPPRLRHRPDMATAANRRS